MFIGGELCESILHELKETAFRIKNIDDYVSNVLFSTKLSLKELNDDSKVDKFKNSSDFYQLIDNSKQLLTEKEIEEDFFKIRFEHLFKLNKTRKFLWDYSNFKIFKTILDETILTLGDESDDYLNEERKNILFKLDGGLKFQFSENKSDFIPINFIGAELFQLIKTEEIKKTSYLKKLSSSTSGKNQFQLFPDPVVKPLDNNYPASIFKDYKAFELFNYLDDNYIDNYEKAKYSNLHHYFSYIGNVLICTQLKYIEFIKENKGITLSRITPKTYKFTDKTISEFKEYHRLFDSNLKK